MLEEAMSHDLREVTQIYDSLLSHSDLGVFAQRKELQAHKLLAEVLAETGGHFTQQLERETN